VIGDIHGVAAGIHGQAHRVDEGGIPGSPVQLSDPGANFITAPDAMVYRLPAVSTATYCSSPTDGNVVQVSAPGASSRSTSHNPTREPTDCALGS
jgi:hypothetical protein